MNSTLSLEEILKQSNLVFNQLSDFAGQIPETHFFEKPFPDKWSIAQHLKHLIISTKTTTAAYALPKFLIQLVAGKPNRPSRSYEELVKKYRQQLEDGAKASGRYIPDTVSVSTGKQNLIILWQKTTAQYIQALQKNWTNEKLDQYIVKHPVLGKITLRELCYFTIYHTQHHLRGISKI